MESPGRAKSRASGDSIVRQKNSESISLATWVGFQTNPRYVSGSLISPWENRADQGADLPLGLLDRH